MTNIYLLYNYNNYFNRQLKRVDTLQEYLSAVGSNYLLVENIINFNPADGISTQWIANLTVLNPPVENTSPDYALVTDGSSLLSRWFVVDMTRTRGGQYNLDLYRDTVAEAWTDIQDVPIFVEKGIVAQNDPMIFNKEDMSFNQIKTREYPIMDEIGIQWIVGYMNPTASGEKSFDPYITADYEYSALNQYPFYQYATGTKMYVDLTGKTYYLHADKSGGNEGYQVMFNDDLVTVSATGGVGSTLIINDESCKNSFGALMKSYAAGITEGIKTDLSVVSDTLSAEDGKIIKVGTAYYKVSLNAKGYEDVARHRIVSFDDAAYTAFETAKNAANTVFPFIRSGATGNFYSYEYKVTKVYLTISINVIPSTTAINYKISSSKRLLIDQPYAMFAMPYGHTTISGVSGLNRDFKEVSMAVAKEIAKEYGGSTPSLYDLQLLPYCPIREYIDQTQGLISVSGKTADADYSLITQGSTNVGIIFWCTSSKATFNVGMSLSVTDYKIDNETQMYRLCSPNYNGQFEFSAAANGGIYGFIVDFTYKPYNPYIHVSPKFGRLYGSDFGDARGLVCGGKFDLPQTSDAWAAYERSNSNYNSIFDRQITNLQVQQSAARTSDIASGIAGIVQGAGAGAAVGAAAGPVGAIAGGVIGGVASAVGAGADYQINEKLRKETMSYTKDMYKYQMGNIKAMPDGLTTVGSLTNNYKKFPFIEVYEATEAEVEALKNKIRYNGMTVGRVDTISNMTANTWQYSNGWNYFKGQLIRADILGTDWHFVNTLKSELDRGIYIGE